MFKAAVRQTSDKRIGSAMNEHARVRTANLLGAIALEAAHTTESAAADVVGQTGAAAAALVMIAAAPGRSVEQLRGALGLSQPGAARLIDRLAQEGWVDHGAVSGRRGFAITLTKAGRKKLAEILKARRVALLDLLSPLDPDAADQLASLLELLLASRTTGQAALERLCRMCERAACSECPVGRAADQINEAAAAEK